MCHWADMSTVKSVGSKLNFLVSNWSFHQRSGIVRTDRLLQFFGDVTMKCRIKLKLYECVYIFLYSTLVLFNLIYSILLCYTLSTILSTLQLGISKHLFYPLATWQYHLKCNSVKSCYCCVVPSKLIFMQAYTNAHWNAWNYSRKVVHQR